MRLCASTEKYALIQVEDVYNDVHMQHAEICCFVRQFDMWANKNHGDQNPMDVDSFPH